MKKIIVIFLSCFVIALFAACSEKKSEIMNENLVTPTETVNMTTVPTDGAAQAVTEPPTAALPKPSATSAPEPTIAAAEIDYTGKKLVALTFDDGPNGDTTPLVLDKLEKYGVVASFFLVGKNITASIKPVLERQLKLGCEINNHSWTHSYMNTFTPDQIKKEIQDTNDAIFKLAGVTPKFFRPPFIATSNDMYDSIDLPFICGIGCNDWDPTVTAEERVETILGSVKDGDIILLHDASGNINTVYALDEIIPGLLDDGYAFVTVSKLFELKGVDPDVENRIWTNVGN